MPPERPSDEDVAATAAAELISADLDRSARRVRDVDRLAANLLSVPLLVPAAEDADAAARVREHHEALDQIADHVHRDELGGQRVMDHRSPWTSEVATLTDRIGASLRQVWPRLHVFGTRDYRWGWTWRADHQLVPTSDRNQDVLAQNTSFDVATGTVHVDHRLTDHQSEVKAFVGFPFTPAVAVGYIDVRPYLQFAVGGYVDVDGSGAWRDGYDKARSYTYGQIYVTSTDASGGDARYEGPPWSRASYDSATPGAFYPFDHSGVLTVGDGLSLQALVVDTRRYVVWVGCYAWAWSAVVPRLATSQVLTRMDATVPFVVVEERPL